MSLPILPYLPGFSWPAKRTPAFNNQVTTALTGRRSATRSQLAPRWNYEIAVQFLRSDQGRTEFTDLLNVYLQCNGSYGTFLFSDPDDNSVTDQQIGVGDGLTTQFFLVRALAGFEERIAALNGPVTIKVNGVTYAASNYSIDPLGVVTFTAPPPPGMPVTWTGAFRWICRFDDDQLDLARVMVNFWEVTKLRFSTEVIVG